MEHRPFITRYCIHTLTLGQVVNTWALIFCSKSFSHWLWLALTVAQSGNEPWLGFCLHGWQQETHITTSADCYCSWCQTEVMWINSGFSRQGLCLFLRIAEMCRGQVSHEQKVLPSSPNNTSWDGLAAAANRPLLSHSMWIIVQSNSVTLKLFSILMEMVWTLFRCIQITTCTVHLPVLLFSYNLVLNYIHLFPYEAAKNGNKYHWVNFNKPDTDGGGKIVSFWPWFKYSPHSQAHLCSGSGFTKIFQTTVQRLNSLYFSNKS